jgi:hypothetical protein
MNMPKPIYMWRWMIVAEIIYFIALCFLLAHYKS